MGIETLILSKEPISANQHACYLISKIYCDFFSIFDLDIKVFISTSSDFFKAKKINGIDMFKQFKKIHDQMPMPSDIFNERLFKTKAGRLLDELMNKATFTFEEEHYIEISKNLNAMIMSLIGLGFAFDAIKKIDNNDEAENISSCLIFSTHFYNSAHGQSSMTNAFDIAHSFRKKQNHDRAQKAAKSKHSKDPRQKIKAEVKERWLEQREERIANRGKAQFCRDMLKLYKDAKSNDLIKDTKTISAWIKDWERELLQNNQPSA